jgi:hypothetical protein
MGNTQSIIKEQVMELIEKMNDGEKIEYFKKNGLLNDELIQLYMNGTITADEIECILFEKINRKNKK